jgi:uncharacterized repeat protein (TIGR03847 family)
MSPQFLALSQVDFITVGTVGLPGERTFYLQAAQGDLLVSLLIEKEHAAALSVGIHRLLDQLGDISPVTPPPSDMELREPIRPLFRVAKMGLGYDEERDALVIVAQAFSEDLPEDDLPEAHFWCERSRMRALADHAAQVVAAGRPQCPLCNEPLVPGERHACVRGNGHQWIYRLED